MYCHQNHRLIHYFCDLEYIFFFVFLFLGRVQIYIPVTVIFCIYIKTAKFTTYFLQSLISFWKIIWSKKWRKKNYKTCPHYTDNIIYKRKAPPLISLWCLEFSHVLVCNNFNMTDINFEITMICIPLIIWLHVLREFKQIKKNCYS